jgi:hypothetical protein
MASAILVCGLLFFMSAVAQDQGTSPQQQVPGFGSSQMDGGIQSSASQQQIGSSGFSSPNYDWLSPGGVSSVSYYNWGYPRSYYYPSNYYRYYYPYYNYGYWPGYSYYYNSYDPWWYSNVYGPYRSTYYWYSW